MTGLWAVTGLPHVRRSFNPGSVSLPDQKEGGGGPGCQLYSHQSACRVLHVSRRASILNMDGGRELKQGEESFYRTPEEGELEGAAWRAVKLWMQRRPGSLLRMPGEQIVRKIC